MARRSRTKRALMFAALGFAGLSCFADAQNTEPAPHHPPEYYDEDSKELSGKLMEMVTERCYAEGIHRQLQIYPHCQEWVREDKVAQELFDSMPATWIAQDVAARNENNAPSRTIPDGCNNICHIEQMSSLCNIAAITAFGWVDQTCNAYQWHRTVHLTNKDPKAYQDSYQGQEGPGDYDGQKVTWGYYRTIQAVASVVGSKAYHVPFKSVLNFQEWIRQIDSRDFLEHRKHWNTWKKVVMPHLNGTDTAVIHDVVTDDAADVDVDAEDLSKELVDAHPLVDKRKKKKKHGKGKPSTTCISRKHRWTGPCGSTDPWISSSLAKPGPLEALMMPSLELTKDSTSGPIAKLANPESPYEPKSSFRPFWYKRMSAALRTSILENVLRPESFLRYVLEAAQNRAWNAPTPDHDQEPVYPKHAYWTWDWQDNLRDRKNSPAGGRDFRKSSMWLSVWKAFKPIEEQWIDHEIAKPAERPVAGRVYRYTYFNLQKEQNVDVYLHLSASRDGQEAALEKNMLLEWDILDQNSKTPTGKKMYRRAKDVVDVGAAAQTSSSITQVTTPKPSHMVVGGTTSVGPLTVTVNLPTPAKPNPSSTTKKVYLPPNPSSTTKGAIKSAA